MPQLYLYLVVVILLMTIGRLAWRPAPKGIDWALIVAFIRLDFPSEQRDVAQRIAAGLAEVAGMKIKQLRPEHTLREIAAWADNQIYATDLIKLFVVAFGVACNEDSTFRELVERVVEKKAKNMAKIS
ncbi:MAG: hypothetical protein GEU77_03600 [Deltaproteobacteria bacterium]|nr:hypothetical protein [Deltaproteobacteria bacterium]